MKLTHIFEAETGFKILETTARSQTALFVLEAGESSSDEPSVHEQSDQILVLLEGDLRAVLGKEEAAMKAGDAVLVPAGTPHKFVNTGGRRAVTFTVYAGPAYPPRETSE